MGGEELPCDDHNGLFLAGFAVCFGKGLEDVDYAGGHGVLLWRLGDSFSSHFFLCLLHEKGGK